MDTRRPSRMCVSFCFLAILLLSACGESSTNTPVVPIINSPTLERTATPVVVVTPTISPSDTPVPSPTTVTPCTPDLTFNSDVTILDNSVVAPGSILDKQWSVQNSGTCDWNEHYTLRLISGPDLGVQEQVLYPARAGTQAVLQMTLHAPLEAGWYTSIWQAVAPDGNQFGEKITITIIVQ